MIYLLLLTSFLRLFITIKLSRNAKKKQEQGREKTILQNENDKWTNYVLRVCWEQFGGEMMFSRMCDKEFFSSSTEPLTNCCLTSEFRQWKFIFICVEEMSNDTWSDVDLFSCASLPILLKRSIKNHSQLLRQFVLF